jgi:hypothetical protein
MIGGSRQKKFYYREKGPNDSKNKVIGMKTEKQELRRIIRVYSNKKKGDQIISFIGTLHDLR